MIAGVIGSVADFGKHDGGINNIQETKIQSLPRIFLSLLLQEVGDRGPLASSILRRSPRSMALRGFSALPATTHRVALQTADEVNEQIRRQTERNVEYYSNADPMAIERRLAELDHEWDIERTLQTNFAIVTLLGITLGQLVNRSWLLFSGAAAGFMIQHAFQGWCPPVPAFRRLGTRTSAEIDSERYALKAVRGDFSNRGE